MPSRFPAHETVMNIFVAESQPFTADSTLAQLGRIGQQAQLFTNAADVMARTSQGRGGLIIVDVTGGGDTGKEMTRQIRTLGKGGMRPKIVAVTREKSGKEGEQFIEAGMDDFLMRPVLAEKLQSVVQLWGEKIVVDAGMGAVFDSLRSRLREFGVDEDPVAVAEIVGVAIPQIRERTVDLDLSYKKSDIKGFYSAIHGLKGGSGGFGTPAFVGMCTRVEKDAGEGAFGVYESIKEELLKESMNVLRGLRMVKEEYESKTPNRNE